MSKATYIITDIWLKELILNNNPDLDSFRKEELIKMIKFLKEENNSLKKIIAEVNRGNNGTTNQTLFDI